MVTINEKTQCISVTDGDKTFLQSGKLSDTQLKLFKKHGMLLISGKDIISTQYELDSFIKDCIKVTKSKETMNGPWMYYNMRKVKKDENDEKNEKKKWSGFITY